MPAFHSLTTYLTRTLEQARNEQKLARKQESELRELFKQLGVKDATEQAQIRSSLVDRQSLAQIRDQIEQQRAEVKRAYRIDPERTRGDEELFDQLVDQEVDKILKTLPTF